MSAVTIAPTPMAPFDKGLFIEARDLFVKAVNIINANSNLNTGDDDDESPSDPTTLEEFLDCLNALIGDTAVSFDDVPA